MAGFHSDGPHTSRSRCIHFSNYIKMSESVFQIGALLTVDKAYHLERYLNRSLYGSGGLKLTRFELENLFES